ncbi:preprotein translocase subunit YajC [Schaalia sp. 19OD2882]|uniref:preprotein translocase subunit YajC n=1 Tax=Schaalia sp. 19OD2882 TaxID=2794089 RepID=UPI0020A77C1D|nr:preprotein translocase subunit YajC [Schaalia sp. 19OD2882]
MAQFFQTYGTYIVLGAVLLGLMWWSSNSRKRMEAQRAEREAKMLADLTPGAWVKTVFGFWGRYVDTDGDIVILETADGTETYWEKKTIQEVGTPPFASDSHEDASVEAADEDEDEETVLGLDKPENDLKN